MIDFVSDDVKASAAFFEKQFSSKISYAPGMEMMPGVSFGTDLGAMLREKEGHDNDQRSIMYITVPSIADEIKRLVSLKAKIRVGATEVPDFGQYAILTIPGGLAFGLWESKDPDRPKTPTTREPHTENTVSFLELTSEEPQKSGDFLSKAFGWKFDHWAEGGDYWYCKGDSKTFSIGLRSAHEHVDTNEVIAFVNVKNVDAALKKVTGKGRAKKLSDKLQMGPFGFYAYLEAPGAFKVGIWENIPHDDHEKKESAKETKEVKEPAAKKAAPAKKAGGNKAPAKKAAPVKKAGGNKAPAKKAAASGAAAGGRKRAASGSAGAPAAKKAKK